MNQNKEGLNLQHLRYAWLTAKLGSMSHASKHLNLKVQTLSGQIRQLEQQVGFSIFAPQGRGLILTEKGTYLMGFADQIFAVEQQMLEKLSSQDRPQIDFKVGLVQGISKRSAFKILNKVFDYVGPGTNVMKPKIKLQCIEGSQQNLMEQLLSDQVDVLISDQPLLLKGQAFEAVALRAYNLALVVPDYLLINEKVDYKNLEFLLPSKEHKMRLMIDHWFKIENIKPNILLEADDLALIEAFEINAKGAYFKMMETSQLDKKQEGVSIFPILKDSQITLQMFFPLRKKQHPGVQAIIAS